MALPAGPIDLLVHADLRGSLVAIEGGKDVPFPIARVYYIYGSNGAVRGFHAHRELEQLMICVAGSCLVMLDDGRDRKSFRLDAPNEALKIEPMIWHEMHDISPDACILVLASDRHDNADYIRDYDQFRALSSSPA